MTTTTNVVLTPGSAYTWNSYPDTWVGGSSSSLSWDTANSANSYALTVTETATTVDAPSNQPTKKLSEAFSTVDARKVSATKNQTEAFATADARTAAVSKFLAEAFSTVEGGFRSPTKKIAEAFTTADAKGKWTYSQTLQQAFATAETVGLQSNWHHTYGESFSTADVRLATTTKTLTEAFNTLDVGSRATIKAMLEVFSTVDVWSRQLNWFRTYGEGLQTVDINMKIVAPAPYVEAFHTAEVLYKAPRKNSIETLNTVDVWSRTVVFFRTYTETATFVELSPHHYSINFPGESFSTQDMLIRRGSIVVNDMVLSNVAISYGTFLTDAASDTPYTYSDYVPFIVGDYSLSKARIKIVMTRDNVAQDTKLTVGTISVDVPNVSDSGRINITSTAGVTPVVFVRTFYGIPEVSVTSVSSTAFAQPRISNITRTGFDVELIDVSNSRLTGTASWTALGY
jgi:hypothetical protein